MTVISRPLSPRRENPPLSAAAALVVPLRPFQEGKGGLRVAGKELEAVGAGGSVVGKIPLPEAWEDELAEYRICARFKKGAAVQWCIGKPFEQRVRFVVEWKQNGYECAGELYLPDSTTFPFSWGVLVSRDVAYFATIPAYEYDVAFPWSKLHDPRDIVLRRRLATLLGNFVCDGNGTFKVSKHDRLEVEVNNFFTQAPATENEPALIGCWPDLFTARRSGKTSY